MGGLEGRVTYGPGYEGEEGLNAENAAGASGIVNSAQGAASSAADTVQQTAGAVIDTAQQATSAVVDTAQQATSAVTGAVANKVDQVTDAAASGVERLADTVAETAFSADASPTSRQVAETTVNVLDRTADYLREGNIRIIAEDLRGVVRRHPLRTLILGLGLGYLARGAFFPSSGAQSQPSNRSLPRGGAPYTPPPRPVPVYTAAGYDVSYSAPVTGELGVGASIPPVSDLSISTSAVGMGNQTETLLVDDLLPGDTLGTADNAIDFPTGSALDVDAGLGADSDAFSSETLGETEGDVLGLASDEQFQVASDEASPPSTIDTMPSDNQLRSWDASSSSQNS